jgi:hypothetical protein
LAEINNTGVGETTVLRAVYFESNDAESEEVATMPIEAWRCTQTFLLSDQERTKLAVVGQSEVGVTGCDDYFL